MYDTLLRLNADGEFDTEVSLATDYERVDDTTFEYTIRTDHSFHDGEPLTAEDIAFTYNYINDNEVPLFSVQAEFLDGAEAVDESTVRIDLAEPLGPFNRLVATQLPDLVDKPLAWSLHLLPSGRSLAHSVLVAVPLVLLVWVVASHRGHGRLGVLFAFGYLSHLYADYYRVVLHVPAEQWPLRLAGLYWPLLPVVGDPAPAFLPHFAGVPASRWALVALGVAWSFVAGGAEAAPYRAGGSAGEGGATTGSAPMTNRERRTTPGGVRTRGRSSWHRFSPNISRRFTTGWNKDRMT
jgi:hypothetical protein